MAYIKINTEEILKADWAKKEEALFQKLVAEVKNNDELFENEMKKHQTEGKKILVMCDELVKKVESGAMPASAYPGALKAATRFKSELAEQAKNAETSNTQFLNAMITFREVNSWKQGTVTEKAAERIGKLRTLSQNKAKILTAIKIKLNQDYTMRLSAMSKVLKALTGQVQTSDEAEKKATSLVEKLNKSVADALDLDEKLRRTAGLIEKYAVSKEEKVLLSVKNYFADIERFAKLYKAHQKTGREMLEALAKIPTATDHVGPGKVEFKKLTDASPKIEAAYKKATEVVNKAKIKNLKDFKFPEVKLTT